jgi:hypothetical protein
VVALTCCFSAGLIGGHWPGGIVWPSETAHGHQIVFDHLAIAGPASMGESVGVRGPIVYVPVTFMDAMTSFRVRAEPLPANAGECCARSVCRVTMPATVRVGWPTVNRLALWFVVSAAA